MKLKKMTPILDAIKIQETEIFYCEYLGFKKISEELDKNNNPYWMHLVNDEMEIMLYQAYEPLKIEAKKKSGFYDFILYFEVEDIESLHKNLGELGCKVSDFGTTEYGMQEFYLKDPNGNQLTFGQAIIAEQNHNPELN